MPLPHIYAIYRESTRKTEHPIIEWSIHETPEQILERVVPDDRDYRICLLARCSRYELFLFLSRDYLTFLIKTVLHTDDGPDFYHQRQ